MTTTRQTQQLAALDSLSMEFITELRESESSDLLSASQKSQTSMLKVNGADLLDALRETFTIPTDGDPLSPPVNVSPPTLSTLGIGSVGEWDGGGHSISYTWAILSTGHSVITSGSGAVIAVMLSTGTYFLRVSATSVNGTTSADSVTVEIESAGGGYNPAVPDEPNVSLFDAGNRTLLTMDDFTYLGNFKFPASLYNQNLNRGYPVGLTHRYVDGQFRLYTFLRGDNQAVKWRINLVEFSESVGLNPSTTTNLSYERNFGEVLPSYLADNNVRGLMWDEQSQKMVCATSSNYSGVSQHDYIYFLSLDDSDASHTVYGRYNMTGISYKAVKGFCPIPAYARQALGGRRVLGGYGGYESVLSFGPASMGPAACAFNPEQFEGLAPGQSAACYRLTHAPHNPNPNTSPYPGIRNPNYWNNGAGAWQPVGGVGYWGWRDHLRDGGIWIDTGTKHGFLLWMTLAGDGQRATIDESFTPVKIGVSGSGNDSVHTWDVRLSVPFESLAVGDMVAWPTTTDSATEAKIISVDEGGYDLRITMQASSQDNPMPPGPIPANSGSPFKGAFYWNAVVKASVINPVCMVYDPTDLVTGNDDPLPLVEEIPWPQAGEMKSAINPSVALETEGVTYDENTGKLYLLQHGTINVWQVSQ